MKMSDDKVEVLLKFLRGELNIRESNEVKSRLKNDKEMAELLAMLKSLRLKGRQAGWNRFFNSAIELSSRQFEDFLKSKKKNQPPYGITVYDSKVLPLQSGIRSEFSSAVDSRRLKYKIDDLELVLSLQPVSLENFDLIGQIIGLEDGITVRIGLRSGTKTFALDTDQFHLFHFKRIPAAKYTLKIYCKNKVLGMVDFKI